MKKKVLALLLVLAVSAGLAACGKPAQGGAQNETTGIENNDQSGDMTEATVVDIVQDLFADITSDMPDATAEELANAIVERANFPFMAGTMVCEEGYLNGFTEEVTGFNECAMFSPMIGSIPFVGYVFVCDDYESANALMETLDATADLRWNICTEADQKGYRVDENKAMFIMAPNSFEEDMPE